MIRIKRLGKSFIYASKGLKKTFKEEQNFRIQSVVGVLIIVLGFYLGISRYEWIVIVLLIGMVLLMELLNSALERVVDLLKPRMDAYVKDIKDIMAAVVMLVSLASVVIGLIIFVPYFSNFFN